MEGHSQREINTSTQGGLILQMLDELTGLNLLLLHRLAAFLQFDLNVTFLTQFLNFFIM